MTEIETPSSADIEKYIGELPRAIISRLPECIEKREAERLVPIIEAFAHQARERYVPPKAEG